MSKSNRKNSPPSVFFDSTIFDDKFSNSRFESLDSLSKYKEDRDVFLSSSFYFGQQLGGLKSTSQLKVDYSNFGNHTFFNSAEVNVNVAFDKFINYYPFDGSKAETALFFEGLTGFEKWLYDIRMSKYTGYLHFSSSDDSKSGHYVEFVNNAGANTNLISSLKTGQAKLAKNIDNAFSIELSYYQPRVVASNNMTIFQAVTGSDGIILSITGSGQPAGSISGSLFFKVASLETDKNNNSFIISGTVKSKTVLAEDTWHHIVAEWDRSSIDNQNLKLYINGSVDNISNNFSITNLNIDGAKCYIGSGSSFGTDADNIYGYLSGSIDEFRIWNRRRDIDEIKLFSNKNVFSQDGLSLKYSFNEPSGSTKDSLVLDSSGNSLHGTLRSGTLGTLNTITDYSVLRINNTGSNVLGKVFPTSSMIYEDNYYSPILFSSHPSLSELKIEMLASASDYDNVNEALITKMIPEHYFYDSSYFELGDENSGPYGKNIDETNRFGNNSSAGAHILAGLLYTWAKMFDEIKIFIDQFENITYYGIDQYDQAPTPFAKMIGDYYGVDIKSFFNDASFRQFFEGEKVVLDLNWISNTMELIRDNLWERIFHALPHVLKSKGTLESIKSYIRAFGINPDSNFRFVEYAGAGSHVDINTVRRIKKSAVSKMINMSASNSYFSTPFLTSSNYDTANHGLLTSQSFTVENIFSLPSNTSLLTQSLCRMMVTGTYGGTSPNPGLLFNVLAISSSNDAHVSSSIKLYGYPLADVNAGTDLIEMAITGVNVFDGEKWNLSWGRNIDTYPSHSYFLRIGKNNFGDIIYNKSTSSWFITNDSLDVTKVKLANNISGSFLSFGSQSIPSANTFAYNFLNRNDIPSLAKSVNFDGSISQVRFWSKYISQSEFDEHTKNFKSLGVKNPLKNFNFSSSYYDTSITGANPHTTEWGRLRLDVSTEQDIISSSADGAIRLLDFSQNYFPLGPGGESNWSGPIQDITWSFSHCSGTGFEPSKVVVENKEFFYSYISPYWDGFANSDRINISDNSFDKEIIEEITPDNRFAIEFSIAHALNEDIVNIFSTMKEMSNIVGTPSDIFSMDYKKLENLRMTYFNRLKDKVNLKGFFDFFCWFDSNIIEFAKQLIPAKTNFIGNNFVIESHMLERSKYQHKFHQQYLNKEKLSLSEKEADYAEIINDNNIEGDV